jgi:hypothetical protein
LQGRDEEEQGNLLKEVNSTLEDLKKWKEKEKKLDEDLEKQLAEKRMNRKVEVDEETHAEVEITAPDIEYLKCQQFHLVQVKEHKPQSIISVPGVRPVENYELFKTGDDLSKVLSEWNSEFDRLNINARRDQSKMNEWEQVDQIEKELAELEELVDGVEFDGD